MSDGTHLTTELRRRAVGAVLEGMSQTVVAAAFGIDRKIAVPGEFAFLESVSRCKQSVCKFQDI